MGEDMEFEEAISNLATKSAIKRAANVGESYRADVSPKDLIKQKKLFLDEKRIFKECCEYDTDFDFRRFLLFLFLNEEDYSIKDDVDVLIKKIKELKNYLLQNEKYIKVNEKTGEIYDVVLDAVIEDKKISGDELNVLEKLRRKLGINIFYHWILRIKKSFFDEINNIDKMTDQKILGHLRNLERKGLLFYVKKGNDRYYVVPEEIANKLNGILDMELPFHKYEELLGNTVLTNKDKIAFLKSKGIDASGTSKELNAKIMFNSFKPSDFLNSLTLKTLHRIANKISIKKSGSKNEIIRNIVNYYREIYKTTEELKDEREVYYTFYEDLANRNSPILIKRGVIEKSEEIGKRFEEATNYLFEVMLGFTLETPKIKNRKHGVKADGKAIKNGGFIVWDCKTKDKYLSINTTERRQFIDYINEYKKVDKGKFISFLIITNEVKNPLDIKRKLNEIKAETDIDISVVKASDLKRFAEEIQKSGIKMDLKPFYHTEILDYERHLKSFVTKK